MILPASGSAYSVGHRKALGRLFAKMVLRGLYTVSAIYSYFWIFFDFSKQLLKIFREQKFLVRAQNYFFCFILMILIIIHSFKPFAFTKHYSSQKATSISIIPRVWTAKWDSRICSCPLIQLCSAFSPLIR